MTIQDALKHFNLKTLPKSCQLLASSVGSPARIAKWNDDDVTAYQLLFNLLLQIKQRKPSKMEMPIRRGDNGKKAA